MDSWNCGRLHFLVPIARGREEERGANECWNEGIQRHGTGLNQLLLPGKLYHPDLHQRGIPEGLITAFSPLSPLTRPDGQTTTRGARPPARAIQPDRFLSLRGGAFKGRR